MKVFWLEKLGSLVAGGGIAYATYVATQGTTADQLFTTIAGPQKILAETGPMETCALGILLWIYAKWRKHVELR